MTGTSTGLNTNVHAADTEPTLSFVALRAVQAEREYFVSVLPLKMVPRLLTYDDGELPPELRAQRVLNAARVPEIARYLTENPSSYVLSAITASIDAHARFEPLEVFPGTSVGRLVIPLAARLLVNDGQHRRAAIEEALRTRPQLGEETVAVIFFVDAGLKRAQQMFADLNRYALRPTRSLGILYDHRDPLACLAREIAQTVAPFAGFTEMEKTSISNRSTKLFTLSGIYQALDAFRGRRRSELSDGDADRAFSFFTIIGKLIVHWGIASADRSAATIRQESIHTHAVALHALGVVGCELVADDPDGWEARLAELEDVDWSRSNRAQWEGRALHGGKISKAGPSVALTAIVLKKRLGLALSDADSALEAQREGLAVAA